MAPRRPVNCQAHRHEPDALTDKMRQQQAVPAIKRIKANPVDF